MKIRLEIFKLNIIEKIVFCMINDIDFIWLIDLCGNLDVLCIYIFLGNERENESVILKMYFVIIFKILKSFYEFIFNWFCGWYEIGEFWKRKFVN